MLVGAAVSPYDVKRAKALEKHVDLLVSDVAHFHNTNILEAAKRLTKEVSVEFIAGNLGTIEGTRDTIEALDGHVAGIRAGVGSGSICVTSEVTKAGAPTLFAVSQIAVALQELGVEIPIIADGGIRAAGDGALALAAGASAVMMGNVFAGCTESPGGLIKIGGKYYKPYRGMGSMASRQKRFAMDRYNQPAKGIAEGVEGVVPYRGDVSTVVEEFASGLRASFGYAGAKSVKDLWQKARFGAVTAAGGGLLSMFLTFDVSLGVVFTLKALVIVILGGVGDIRGTIIASFILGFAETAVATLIDPGLTLAAAYILFMIVLLVRPEGLLGRRPA